MTIKLKNLKSLFPYSKDIAAVLGITRQAVDQTTEFKTKDKVRKLEKAAEARLKEIKADYQAIKKGAKRVIKDDSS